MKAGVRARALWAAVVIVGGGLAVTAVATTSASAQPGSLDASFGTSGVAVSTLGGNAVGANGVTIVPSGVTGAGDVVTAGWSQAPTATTPQFQVAELSPTGALSWQASAALPAGEATAVTVLTSGTLTGDIVAVGYKLNAGCTPDIQPVVVALTPAGALDPSFGTGGIADPNAPCGGRFNAVTTDSAGNIVAAGFTLTGVPPETLVARFSPGGTPDTSFASTGYASLQLGGALDVRGELSCHHGDGSRDRRRHSRRWLWRLRGGGSDRVDRG